MTEADPERTIVIERVVNGPRETVWRAWTDPAQIPVWWGPDGFTTTMLEMDVRVGGRWRYIMHGPDGKDWPNRVVYREIVKPERLAYDHGSDIDDDPDGFQSEATFEDVGGGRTRVRLRMVLKSAAAREAVIKFGAVELGHQTLGRLDGFVAGR
jgi:uncharacterized protein YndB with AHSA1/START domain